MTPYCRQAIGRVPGRGWRGIGDVVPGGIAMTTRNGPSGLGPDAQQLGTGMQCRPVTAPSRGNVRMGPNGGPMQDLP